MRLVALIGCISISGAFADERAATAPSTSAESTLDRQFVKWAKETDPIGYRALAARFVTAARRDAGAYERAVSRLTAEFAADLAANGGSPSADTPEARVARLRSFLFEKCGFEADLDLTRTENLFPDAIIERRRGYCLGLSLLILDIAERLDWPMMAVSAPRHTFVRYRGSPPVNLETTLAGATHDDEWYQERFGLGEKSLGLVKALTPRETAAHLLNNHGFSLLERRDLDGAAIEFERALELDPNLVEARINQGVLSARRGEFEAALDHFRAAARSWPTDPLIQLNVLNARLHVEPAHAIVADACALITGRPHLPGVDRLGEAIVERLDVTEHWSAVQRVRCALNERQARVHGKRPGLVGSYFSDERLERLRFQRVDRDVSFRWGWNSPDPTIPNDHFSVRWDGWFQVERRDDYTIFVTCSDGIRIWVDGRRILNAWTRANDAFTKATIDLEPGLHDLRIEYFESVGQAGVSLLLTAEKEDKALDFASRLFHPRSPE